MLSEPTAGSQLPDPVAIFLTGFMGAGKTTVGLTLARKLEWPFHDLDTSIEILANQEIPLIFKTHGEDVFRDFEHAAVVQHVEGVMAGQPIVLALGGGTFAFDRNRDKLRSAGVTIWLEVSPDTLWKRVRNDTYRPLAGDREEFFRLYSARERSYALANERIDATGTAEEVGNRIMALRCVQELRKRD